MWDLTTSKTESNHGKNDTFIEGDRRIGAYARPSTRASE